MILSPTPPRPARTTEAHVACTADRTHRVVVTRVEHSKSGHVRAITYACEACGTSYTKRARCGTCGASGGHEAWCAAAAPGAR